MYKQVQDLFVYLKKIKLYKAFTIDAKNLWAVFLSEVLGFGRVFFVYVSSVYLISF